LPPTPPSPRINFAETIPTTIYKEEPVLSLFPLLQTPLLHRL
jgi:hypothetical protein